MVITQRAFTITGILVTLVMTLVLVGRAQPQGTDLVYRGTFTLTQRIHWGKSILRPGHYTITMASKGLPVIVKIQNEDTKEAFRVMAGAYDERVTGIHALLLQVKNGQLSVQSLSLSQIGMVLIYEPALARDSVLDAHAAQVVPIHR